MEHKSYLVGFTLVITLMVICANWYTGLESYVHEEQFIKEEDMTYKEARELNLKVDFNHEYFSQRELVLSSRKTYIPFVFETDTLHDSGVGYYQRKKPYTHTE